MKTKTQINHVPANSVQGAVSGSCFLSVPNRIRVNNREHEFLCSRNTITANS